MVARPPAGAGAAVRDHHDVESRSLIVTVRTAGQRNGPSAGHGRAVLARAGRMLLDKDGSRRGWRGSDGRSASSSICDGPVSHRVTAAAPASHRDGPRGRDREFENHHRNLGLTNLTVTNSVELQ